MLDPTEAGGGCLRNLGPHGLDMFLHLTGEEAQVTGAQLSRRAHERPVEDYASVMLDLPSVEAKGPQEEDRQNSALAPYLQRVEASASTDWSESAAEPKH